MRGSPRGVVDPGGGRDPGAGSSHRLLRSARASAQRQRARVHRLDHSGLAGEGLDQDDLHHSGKSVGTERNEMACRRQPAGRGEAEAKRRY
jgi:hypothetical protein